MSTVLIKFSDKGKHLRALFNKMESRKLGKLKVFPAVGDCGKTQKGSGGTGSLKCVLSPYNVKTSLQKVVDFKLAGHQYYPCVCHIYRALISIS